MRVPLLLAALCLGLCAEILPDLHLNLIWHNEYETASGHADDAELPGDHNAYTTLFADLGADVAVHEELFFSLAARANGILAEDTYDTTAYASAKPGGDELNRILISEASANYDDGLFALSAGRQAVTFDWLQGSIDGVLAMVGSDATTSLRLFWFDDYYLLQYNYFMQIKAINRNRGMYGAIAKIRRDPLELTLFDYHIHDLRTLAGAHLHLIFENVGFNVSHSEALALGKALYDYDESFSSLSIEGLVGRHYLEFGASQTGENGLLAMIQMGSFMFGQFYLGNQVDRENARNGFLKYIYHDRRWRFEAVGGLTTYDNNFIRVEKGLHSRELDGYLKYRFDRRFSADAGLMWMDVDGRDPLQVDQTFAMLNLVFDYESF